MQRRLYPFTFSSWMDFLAMSFAIDLVQKRLLSLEGRDSSYAWMLVAFLQRRSARNKARKRVFMMVVAIVSI